MGEQVFIDVLGQGGGNASGQDEGIPGAERVDLCLEAPQHSRGNGWPKAIDRRFFRRADFDVDARIAVRQGQKGAVAAVESAKPLDFAARETCREAQHFGRYAEAAQDEGDVDALAAGIQVFRPTAVDGAGDEAGQMDDVVQGRIESDRVNQGCTSLGKRGPRPAARRRPAACFKALSHYEL